MAYMECLGIVDFFFFVNIENSGFRDPVVP